MTSCAVHLKSKAYFILCPAHDKNGKIFSNIKLHESLQNMGIEISLEQDFEILEKEIAESNFHGYASLLFFVELECYHIKIDMLLNFVYHSILMNPTLKYVSKLVVNYSQIDMQYGKTTLTVRFNGGSKRLNFEYPTEAKVRELFPDLKEDNFKFYEELPGTIMMKVLADSDIHRNKFLDILRRNLKTKIPFIDNLVVLSCLQTDLTSTKTILEEFIQNLIALSDRDSIQELAQTTIANCNNPRIYQDVADVTTTCAGGCYVYNINPALAIVINHQTFPDSIQLDFRKDSLKDIEALQRTFRMKKITYITVSDGSLEDVQAIMKKVRTALFKGIKDIFVVIMSHGDEGDIVYTKTGSYSIRDEIVFPLLENPTLANAQKFIIVNACRGNYDPRCDDNAELLEKIQKKLCDTVIYPQDEKLMMIFSTQKGCISLRFDEIGSIFIQQFCDSFSFDFYEKPMEAICQETQQLMAFHVYEDQIPEFQTNDDRPHNIKMEFANFFSNQEFLQDMTNFFKKQFQNDTIDCNFDAISIGRHNIQRILGLGYADGRCNNVHKEAMENYMKSKYASKVVDNCQDSKIKFEWTIEERSGRSRVLVAIEDD